MLDYIVRILFSGQQATSEAKKVSESFAGIENAARSAVRYMAGFVGAGAILGYVKQTMSWASAIGDLAKQTGVSAEKLQAWGYAAQLSGASQEDITAALRRLAIAQVEAAEAGKGEAFNAFARFGMTLEQIRTLRTEQVFERISAAVKNMGASAQVTADIVQLMGRSADNLLPSFREGFGAAAEQAQKLGLIISSEDIAAIKKLDDALTTMQIRSRAEAGTIIGMASDPHLGKAFLRRDVVGRFFETLGEEQAGLYGKKEKSITDWLRMFTLGGWIGDIGSAVRQTFITTGEVGRHRQMLEAEGLRGPTGALESPVTMEILHEIRLVRQASERTANAVDDKL